ncbi:MAG: zf-HC2 domain-containing protein [Abditibacteriota bacterium]|jgi:anti-sigma factor RsiW|nr:zf-HC2 domain-containing protein [Abditibacteriota bacterium]
MNCDSIRNLLPDYEDKSLSAKTNEAIESHLQECSDCAETLALLEKSKRVLSAVSSEPAPAGLRQNVIRECRKTKASLFDVFFGLGHSPYRAGFAVGAALLAITVVCVNVANISGRSTKYETYQTANLTGVYETQFTIDKHQ